MPEPSPPRKGDIIWLDFDPQIGVEQANRRPAIVLTPHAYNDRVGLSVVCPITNQRKGRPFEVHLPPGLTVTGVILVDHVKSLDWRERNAELISQAPVELINHVLDVLADLLEL
jgi:mRNA interferase MazF